MRYVASRFEVCDIEWCVVLNWHSSTCYDYMAIILIYMVPVLVSHSDVIIDQPYILHIK